MTQPPQGPSTWGLITSLPMPGEVQAVLRSLAAPPRPHGRKRLPDDSLSESYVLVDEQDVRHRLGFPPPTLSALCGPEVREHFASPVYRPLPSAEDITAGAWHHLSILYVPRALQWQQVQAARAVEHGVTHLSLTYEPGSAWTEHPPLHRPMTHRLPVSGDSLRIDIAGTRIGVQHRLAGQTRLAWVHRAPHGAYNVEVLTPPGAGPRGGDPRRELARHLTPHSISGMTVTSQQQRRRRQTETTSTSSSAPSRSAALRV
ncbi:hypothetical protein [Kineococcus sp. G2]|uniref:hypothetical protein n=1 Tax=Kineococcus sp. G2 TaxID=3127484 RepID=UPI00301C5CB4